MNTDYKIGAKALASRLKRVIKQCVGDYQTGFITNRFIGENIRFILDLINYANDTNLPGLLFFLDFEKAFDCIERGFIDRSLAYFTFGQSFRRWVSTLYINSTACVCNNGHSTGFFSVTRGVRQGCPLSPYLFILCADILSRAIIYNNNIKGISIHGYEVKVIQYADDTVVLLDGTVNSSTELFNTLNTIN